MERLELAMEFERRRDAEIAYRLVKELYETLHQTVPSTGSHCFLSSIQPVPRDVSVLKAA